MAASAKCLWYGNIAYLTNLIQLNGCNQGAVFRRVHFLAQQLVCLAKRIPVRNAICAIFGHRTRAHSQEIGPCFVIPNSQKCDLGLSQHRGISKFLLDQSKGDPRKKGKSKKQITNHKNPPRKTKKYRSQEDPREKNTHTHTQKKNNKNPPEKDKKQITDHKKTPEKKEKEKGLPITRSPPKKKKHITNHKKPPLEKENMRKEDQKKQKNNKCRLRKKEKCGLRPSNPCADIPRSSRLPFHNGYTSAIAQPSCCCGLGPPDLRD